MPSLPAKVPGATPDPAEGAARKRMRARGDLRKLGVAISMVALTTGLGFVVYHYLGLADVMMLYMLCITVAALQFGRWPSLTASVLSILALDYCFIEPRYSFVLTDMQHIGTFAVMLGVGWVILGLVERIRTQTRLALEQERHTRTLYRLGKVLAEGGSVAAIRLRVEAYLSQELEVPLAVLLCDGKGRLDDAETGLPPEVLRTAQAALDTGVPAGHGTETLPQSGCLMLPLPGTERPQGVLALLSAMPPDRLGLLVPMAAQIALAMERSSLARERTEARIRAEHEQLRSNLLSSISHDLRTPLGTITGATTTLLDPGPQAAPALSPPGLGPPTAICADREPKPYGLGTGGAAAPGAGLGLAICRGISQAHGGTILAQTRPQGGARITMALPLDGVEGMPPDLNPDFTP